MIKLQGTLVLVIINLLGIASEEQCEKTLYMLSKCYQDDQYQWIIEIPATNSSCLNQKVSQPKAVPCDFACSQGETFDKTKLSCKKCPSGTFSLGGGRQYTFNQDDDIQEKMPDLTLKATSMMARHADECSSERLWKIKGDVLQGDVQPRCALSLSLRFTLERPGSLDITYNLATSYVFGTISARCDFTIPNDDIDDEDTISSKSRKSSSFTLRPTGYGNWTTKSIKIVDEGEYKLSLYSIGINTFHFPFSIRSIIIKGTSFIQECIPCTPGTFATERGSNICTPCKSNTYAASKGSLNCLPCDSNTRYSDEGATTCLQRPICEAKHYQKVFIGCDKSDTATIKYEPIQPQICINGGPPTDVKPSPCGTCNPGMYKSPDSNQCLFCPAKTYSSGTFSKCLECSSELSLLPGLYYKNWNTLPDYLNRTYMSFDETKNLNLVLNNQSWVPSIDYISSQAIADALSMLTLSIVQGFRITDIAKINKEFGVLSFKFSMQCQISCTLFLVSEDIFEDDNNDDWEVIHKWSIQNQTEHKNKTSYQYSIAYPDPVRFSWLFMSDNADDAVNEVRIYEILVTNTKLGGSDRCVSCLTANDQKTECKSCTPGYILSNATCIACPSSTIASRMRTIDLVPTVCKQCTNNTISDDGVSCYVPCKQAFNGDIQYDLNPISTIEFHGPKLFTQKGSGYFHVFNTSICGKTRVTCAKTASDPEDRRSRTQAKIESRLCRMGSVPDKESNITSVAYIDEFGEELVNVSLYTSKYFPSLRSDYNLSDITFVYRANTSSSQSSCSERITFLSLRCDNLFDVTTQTSSIQHKLQTPNDCVTGTCDGCVFHFLLRTPVACPICDENSNGFRVFYGPCRFGRQEVRKIPFPYCSHNLTEKVETRQCSILSIEVQVIIGLFIVIAGILVLVVIICWRKNRKLEYRYMQLIEHTNPDDDAPPDNMCAQISDEEDSGDEVQFKSQSRTKKIMNVVRKAIGKGPKSDQSEAFGGDSFLLASTTTNEA